ncbi:unnamed protein product, partial [Soboliphyme baturini]|uniref:TPR_REGION domain-containing protein n=1 Tax=Soboliphyme baturini TaxID=241478 RepID=A0A183J1K3_9BILA
QDNFDEAKFYADKTLASDKYNPEALINRGNVAFALGRYSEAQEYYRAAWSSESTSFRALYNMGLAYENMNQYEAALDCFNKLRGAFPHDAQILCNIARMYMQASCIVPNDPFILAKIAELYERESGNPQALQYYHEVMK